MIYDEIINESEALDAVLHLDDDKDEKDPEETAEYEEGPTDTDEEEF